MRSKSFFSPGFLSGVDSTALMFLREELECHDRGTLFARPGSGSPYLAFFYPPVFPPPRRRFPPLIATSFPLFRALRGGRTILGGIFSSLSPRSFGLLNGFFDHENRARFSAAISLSLSVQKTKILFTPAPPFYSRPILARSFLSLGPAPLFY